jgi:hypothetical protein
LSRSARRAQLVQKFFVGGEMCTLPCAQIAPPLETIFCTRKRHCGTPMEHHKQMRIIVLLGSHSVRLSPWGTPQHMTESLKHACCCVPQATCHAAVTIVVCVRHVWVDVLLYVAERVRCLHYSIQGCKMLGVVICMCCCTRAALLQNSY